MDRSLVIGIAGGTGSGKTTVAKKIASFFAESECVVVDQDSYYKDLSHLPMEERKRVNFDHPDAFDAPLLTEHLKALQEGKTVEKPVYSYTHHCRLGQTTAVEPAPIILIEGILVLEMRLVRDCMDVKIFVDTDDDIRLLRRVRRDIHERGRDIEGVIHQYETTVRPMHLAFVLPSKRYADIVIPRGGENDVGIQMVASSLREKTRSFLREK